MGNLHLRDIKKGEFFKIAHNGRVWIKGDYCRSQKRFSCHLFEDVNNEKFFSGDRVIYTQFEF